MLLCPPRERPSPPAGTELPWLGSPTSVLCSSPHQYVHVLAWLQLFSIPVVHPNFPALFQLGSLPHLTLLSLGVHLVPSVPTSALCTAEPRSGPWLSPNQAMAN